MAPLVIAIGVLSLDTPPNVKGGETPLVSCRALLSSLEHGSAYKVLSGLEVSVRPCGCGIRALVDMLETAQGTYFFPGS